ncbi:hypothetical protein [Gemmiger sp.]|uniref:hypothetical protein n=1 Tax=Gemmiger sp. TaxID=2049027 RepID=UPI002A817D26|nr:hypothetical protein [Gemmiger sp.]MDY4448386.1 hypothetical protein [Gemmiger sp.]
MKRIWPFLRKSKAAMVLLAVELAIIGFTLAQAVQPAANYEIMPDQWEVIAKNATIDYDEEGRIGAVEPAEEESILRTSQLRLSAGHYKIEADYNFVPTQNKDEQESHAGVYFMADDAMVVTGERELFAVGRTHDTVVLNVRYTNKTIRLVAYDGGGVFTLGKVTIQQDRVYAWVRVLGWLLAAFFLDLLLLLFLPTSPLAIRNADLRGCLFLLGGAVLLASMPVLMQGVGIFGDDIHFHLSRIDAIAQGLKAGQFPVRIYSQAKNGYGYAPSLFYGELCLYFPAVLRTLGVSVQLSYHLYVLAMQMLTAGIAFYSFRQMFSHNKTALLGSVLYLLNPYRLQNLYWRAAVGEYTAMAFLPLIPAALCLLYGRKEPTKKQAGVACTEMVIAFGMLLQTHMISLEIMALATAVFCLFHLRRTFSRCVLFVWLKSVAIVLLLNLWFLLPFLEIMGSGIYGGMYGGTTMNAGRMIQRSGYAIPKVLTWNTHGRNIGIELIIGCMVFLWAWIGHDEEIPHREQKIGLWSTGIGLAACWASTNTFPWGLVGALPGKISGILLAIQFPWRYLTLAAILLTLATLCAVSLLRPKKLARPLAVLLLSASLLGVGFFYREYLPSESGEYVGDSGELVYVDYLVTNVAWYYDKLYLPIGAKETRDGFVIEKKVTTAEVEQIEKTEKGVILQYTAGMGEDGIIELPLLYYPVYGIKEGAGTLFKTENGMLGIQVPAGSSGTIRVAVQEPLRWRLAELVSAVTVLVWIGSMKKKKRKTLQGKA